MTITIVIWNSGGDKGYQGERLKFSGDSSSEGDSSCEGDSSWESDSSSGWMVSSVNKWNSNNYEKLIVQNVNKYSRTWK